LSVANGVDRNGTGPKNEERANERRRRGGSASRRERASRRSILSGRGEAGEEKNVDVAKMTMKEFKEAVILYKIAFLPMGSTEEHGRHLPLDTDTMQVVRTAELAAEKIPFLLLPAVHYGYCRSTADHPGTVSISPETLRRLVFDIGLSLYKQGIRGLIISSGHAGGIHLSALEEAGEALLEKCPDLEVAVFCEYHWASEAGKSGIVETAGDSHAGEIETSRIMAIDPALVKGSAEEEYPRFQKPFLSRKKLADWPGGVWGDPSKASAEKGARLYEKTSERLVELVRTMRERLGALRLL
jgi:creatinine amidohydrolase